MNAIASVEVGTAPDPHMGWLAAYRQLLEAFDASHATNPDGDPAIRQAIADIARHVVATPATTREGLLAKALLIVDQHLGDTDADRVMAEAVALNMIGAAA